LAHPAAPPGPDTDEENTKKWKTALFSYFRVFVLWDLGFFSFKDADKLFPRLGSGKVAQWGNNVAVGRLKVSGFRCQVSAQPTAKKTSGLIEKEILKNRMSKECIPSVL